MSPSATTAKIVSKTSSGALEAYASKFLELMAYFGQSLEILLWLLFTIKIADLRLGFQELVSVEVCAASTVLLCTTHLSRRLLVWWAVRRRWVRTWTCVQRRRRAARGPGWRPGASLTPSCCSRRSGSRAPPPAGPGAPARCSAAVARSAPLCATRKQGLRQRFAQSRVATCCCNSRFLNLMLQMRNTRIQWRFFRSWTPNILLTFCFLH